MAVSTGTTATTAQANELCIGCIAFAEDRATESPTNSFTEVTERASGAPDLTVLERIVSATGTYGTTVSWTGAAPLNTPFVELLLLLKIVNQAGLMLKNLPLFLSFKS